MANIIHDDLKALEIIALKSREKPDFGSEVRKLCRWFSKEFSTPLEEVEKMDLHYILLHKYESFINGLNDEDYLKYKNQLLYPEKLEQIAEEDDSWIEAELQKELEAEQKKLKQPEKEQEELNLTEDFDIQF